MSARNGFRATRLQCHVWDELQTKATCCELLSPGRHLARRNGRASLAELDEHRAELRCVPPLNFALAAGRTLGGHQFKFSRDRD